MSFAFKGIHTCLLCCVWLQGLFTTVWCWSTSAFVGTLTSTRSTPGECRASGPGCRRPACWVAARYTSLKVYAHKSRTHNALSLGHSQKCTATLSKNRQKNHSWRLDLNTCIIIQRHLSENTVSLYYFQELPKILLLIFSHVQIKKCAKGTLIVCVCASRGSGGVRRLWMRSRQSIQSSTLCCMAPAHLTGTNWTTRSYWVLVFLPVYLYQTNNSTVYLYWSITSAPNGCFRSNQPEDVRCSPLWWDWGKRSAFS